MGLSDLGYTLVPIEVIEEFFLVLALVVIAFILVWFRVFAYSPDRRYRMNRLTGFVMRSTVVFADQSWMGGFEMWDGVGFARDKMYVLGMWGQGLKIDVESNIVEKELAGK